MLLLLQANLASIESLFLVSLGPAFLSPAHVCPFMSSQAVLPSSTLRPFNTVLGCQINTTISVACTILVEELWWVRTAQYCTHTRRRFDDY